MTFRSDYPGAIVVEAKNYGYIINNNPKGFVYHTPEEDADDDPQTPGISLGQLDLQVTLTSIATSASFSNWCLSATAHTRTPL